MISSAGKEGMNLGWKGGYRPGNSQDWAEMMGLFQWAVRIRWGEWRRFCPRGVPQDMLTDGSQRRRVPVESMVSSLRLVLVCDEWVTPRGWSADHITPALVSPQVLAAWCRKASPLAHWPRVFLWAQGRLHAPAEDPWVLPTPPASFRVCWAGPGQVPPDMCEHLALPFWALNTVTSCPALASGLSPAGAEAVPPGSCHPE